MKKATPILPDFIDSQDTFSQTMCQAQAVIAALSNDDQFNHMETDHVASLLLLIRKHLEQLNVSYSDTLVAIRNGNSL